MRMRTLLTTSALLLGALATTGTALADCISNSNSCDAKCPGLCPIDPSTGKEDPNCVLDRQKCTLNCQNMRADCEANRNPRPGLDDIGVPIQPLSPARPSELPTRVPPKK
jgi:hypothetical protein